MGEEQGAKKTLSNFDLWQLRMREVTSPQNFIDMGIYFTVSSYLQRRVWTNADHQKLYPNIYPILVADPGVGKGLVIKPVMDMIKKHKLTDALAAPVDMSSVSNVANAAIEASDFAKAGQSAIKLPRERLRIPIGPDNGTYESIVKICAESVRSIGYKRYDKKLDKIVSDVYRHNSLSFALEEMSSFLHKDAEKAMQFLIKAYDCGDYSYTTIGRGEDYIKDICMNFMAGTTPGFIEDCINDRMLKDGFSARCWFVYAARNRFYKLRSPELTDEQLEAQKKLEDHMLALTKIYGYCPFTDEAWAYIEKWWEQEQCAIGYKRPNPSEKLNTYYGRKNIHIMKMSMILHFLEDASVKEDGHSPANPITLATTKRAMSILDGLEVNMHLALNFAGANPLDKLAKKIVRALGKLGPMTGDEILLEFWSHSPTPDPAASINEVIQYLLKSKQINFDEKNLKYLPVMH